MTRQWRSSSACLDILQKHGLEILVDVLLGAGEAAALRQELRAHVVDDCNEDKMW